MNANRCVKISNWLRQRRQPPVTAAHGTRPRHGRKVRENRGSPSFTTATAKRLPTRHLRQLPAGFSAGRPAAPAAPAGAGMGAPRSSRRALSEGVSRMPDTVGRMSRAENDGTAIGSTVVAPTQPPATSTAWQYASAIVRSLPRRYATIADSSFSSAVCCPGGPCAHTRRHAHPHVIELRPFYGSMTAASRTKRRWEQFQAMHERGYRLHGPASRRNCSVATASWPTTSLPLRDMCGRCARRCRLLTRSGDRKRFLSSCKAHPLHFTSALRCCEAASQACRPITWPSCSTSPRRCDVANSDSIQLLLS